MNIFANYKATEFFIETLDALDMVQQPEWSKMVKQAFLDKVTSDEQLENYKLTLDDLTALRQKFFNRNKDLVNNG